MNPDSRPRKKSRFFSGGRSVLGLLSGSSHHRHDQGGDHNTDVPCKPQPLTSDSFDGEQSLSFASTTTSGSTPATSFESATSGPSGDTDVNKGKGVDLPTLNPGYTANNETSASLEQQQQAHPGPPVSVTVSALENLSVRPKKRQGLGPDDFERLRRDQDTGLQPPDWQSHLAPQTTKGDGKGETPRPHQGLSRRAAIFPGREGLRPRTPPGGWHNRQVTAGRKGKDRLQSEIDGKEWIREEYEESEEDDDDNDEDENGSEDQQKEHGASLAAQGLSLLVRQEQLSAERSTINDQVGAAPSQQPQGHSQSQQGGSQSKPGFPANAFGRVGLQPAQLRPFQHAPIQPPVPTQQDPQASSQSPAVPPSHQHQILQGQNHLPLNVQRQIQSKGPHYVLQPRQNTKQPARTAVPSSPHPTPTASRTDPTRRQPLIFDDAGPLNATSTKNPDLTATLNPILSSAHAINPTPSQTQNINLNNVGITNLPLHATRTPNRRVRPTPFLRKATVPPNLYTSPCRIPNALAAAASRKRKRPGIILPPQPFIYIRTNGPSFNIFAGILLYPELCFHLAQQLRVADLISLYAISRDFHTILDTRLTTAILSQSTRKAPESSHVFPFRCYLHLCRPDPARRIPHPDPRKAVQCQPRLVPSFRWLRMVLWREKVVHEIMSIMAEDGVPLPVRCGLALKRMWFMLDIPDNARRIGYIHATTLFTDLDLYFAMCLFVKMDMRFNDPVAQQVRHGVRKLILAQRSLTFFLRVLKRRELAGRYDAMRAWVRWRYEPRPDEYASCQSIFGVPIGEVGRQQWEYWGKRTKGQLGREVQYLLRPEQLVMREAVRRGIRFHKHFMRCLLYGYVRPEDLEDYAPRQGLGRRIPGLGEEYEVDDEVGGVECLPEGGGDGDGDEGEDSSGGISEGFSPDPLLDLGERKEVSLFCVKPKKMRKIAGLHKDDQETRRKEEEFLKACMKWCEDERQCEDAGGAGGGAMDLD